VNQALFKALSALLLLSAAALAGWEVVPSGTTNSLSRLAVSGSRLYAIGTNGTFLRSDDTGKIWAPVSQMESVPVVALTFAGSTGLLVASEGRLFRTSNSGETWTAGPTFDTAFRFYDIQLRANGKAVLFGSRLGDFRIWKSTDGGNTWGLPDSTWLLGETLSPIGANGSGGRFCFSPSDTGYLGAGAAILKTINGGSTWTVAKHMSHDSDFSATFISSCSFFTGSRGVFTGIYYGHMVQTQNGAASLTPRGTHALAGVFFSAPAIGFGVGSSSTGKPKIMRTADGGETWATQELPVIPANAYLNDVLFLNANIGVAVGRDGTILRTTDGGGSPVALSPAPRSTARPRIGGLFGKMVDALGRAVSGR
jgi:photosystem II stability/assembly factor-like uncharacterized protein